MANTLQQAGASSEPTSFAPLHTNRIFTGLWTNRNVLRDAATSDYQEKYGMSRQDSILGGQNSEITSRLTLRRRPGSGLYNSASLPPANRFYPFSVFGQNSQSIRVMMDTVNTVYDATAGSTTPIYTKDSHAGPTFFLGVGNILYFTDGWTTNQWNYATNQVFGWGIRAATNAPQVFQAILPNPYQSWHPSTIYARNSGLASLFIKDSNGNMQQLDPPAFPAVTGSTQPVWVTSGGIGAVTIDGTVRWFLSGPAAWAASTSIGLNQAVSAAVNTPNGPVQMTFQTVGTGTTGSTEPNWPNGIGLSVVDNGITWVNRGLTLDWTTGIGPDTAVTSVFPIVDPNGYFQDVLQPGKSGPGVPSFSRITGTLTSDNSLTWKNTGPFAPATTAPVQYGFAYKNSVTNDISNMSAPTDFVSIIQGNQVTLKGPGSNDTQVDKIVLYRTVQGGSTFFWMAEINNPTPGSGIQWQFTDTVPDSALNILLQAQRNGEGTPLFQTGRAGNLSGSGTSCLGYHVGRIFAGIGNVIAVSSGPDAIVSGSSGNAGFNIFFTAQSRVTRFWPCSLGMVVFTVRDAYIILGSGTAADPLYMVTFIEQLPLLHYDAFTVNKTTPMMMLGNNMVIALDPSAGIVEVGFPIADRFEEEFDPAQAFVTYHSQSSRESALYVGNGNGYWYRMNQNNAPEQGSAWSPRANIAGMGCVQSVEITPGVFRLLYSGTTAGPIRMRDLAGTTDNGAAYPVDTVFGSIVMAQPGQLAALSFITLESVRVGTRAQLALLLGEISGEFEELKRTRQDPTNLPPSTTLFSDRYHFAQNQKAAWCRHFQMKISWPAEAAFNELLTFTIFGQTWQEMRSQ